MSSPCRASQVDHEYDFEVVDGSGIPSTCYPSDPFLSTSRSSHSTASSTQNPTEGKESYITSLRSAFSKVSLGKETKDEKLEEKGKEKRQKRKTSPQPPPPSRRASYSSDSSLEEVNLDPISDVFAAALSFGKTCDRIAAVKTRRTAKNHPLAAAYNLKASWGDAFSGGEGQRLRNRPPTPYYCSDDDDDGDGSKATVSSSSTRSSVLGFASLLNAVLKKKSKE